MARILSQSLLHSNFSSPSRLLAVRARSDKPQLIEIDLGSSSDDPAAPAKSDLEIITVRRLEDAIHGYIIRKSAPDWLPFVPGASYWVPPKRRSVGVVEVVERMPDLLTEEESLSRMSPRGWPSAKYFMEGMSPHPIKRAKEAAAQSDDED